MIYVKLKDVLSILDTVSSDEGIRRKCKAIRKRLKELPTEDVEKVVRCKDCINSRQYDKFSCFCDYFAENVSLSGFCSYGERKEGAEK